VFVTAQKSMIAMRTGGAGNFALKTPTLYTIKAKQI
jgi:hypothetical protein